MSLMDHALLSDLCAQDDIPPVVAHHWRKIGLWAVPRDHDYLVTVHSWRRFVRNYRHGCEQDPDFPNKALARARANNF